MKLKDLHITLFFFLLTSTVVSATEIPSVQGSGDELTGETPVEPQQSHPCDSLKAELDEAQKHYDKSWKEYNDAHDRWDAHSWSSHDLKMKAWRAMVDPLRDKALESSRDLAIAQSAYDWCIFLHS